MPKVSVVIPTYNRQDFITQAIDSVSAQTYDDYEIIIVDDGSTDHTREILKPYLAKSNIRYFYQENLKQAAARNNGIRRSTGEYIAFLDSDDLWHPEKLALQVQVLEESPEIGMVYSNQDIMKNGFIVKKMKYPREILKSGCIFEDLLLRRFYCSTPGLLIRRSVLEDVGLFDESLQNALEDWELTLRISQKYKVLCVDRPLFQRRLHVGAAETYFEKRIYNHQKILSAYLNKSYLSKSFTNTVWAKAYYSWGCIYFENYRYRRARQCFAHAFKRGYWITSIPLMLSLFGVVGKKLFDQLLKPKELISK